MKKKNILTILATLCMLTGFVLLFYPDLSNLQKSLSHGAILREYDRMVAELAPEQIDYQLRRAAIHNAHLGSLNTSMPLLLGDRAPLPEDYEQTLYVQGVMAWLDIPVINLSLPVFHGSGPEILERGVGHLEGTAFPTGGYSTHSALTTHSGLSHARFFTDLELLNYGDIFFISVLGQRLAYQVDQITIILPHEIEWLRVAPGKDFMTLITCTPYAINSHRLLVRGERIPYVQYMAEEIAPIAVPTGLGMRASIFAAFILINLYLWRAGRRPHKHIQQAEPDTEI